MRQDIAMPPCTVTAPGVPDARRGGTSSAANEVANYQRLKKLDELLDVYQEMTYRAQHDYEKTLHRFATECHQLWQQEKAQGNRQGKGFQRLLQQAGIKVGRAYRAMKRFFPADFPFQKSTSSASVRVPDAHRGFVQRSGTSSAANEVVGNPVGLRFTGKLQPRGGDKNEATEVLECVFALTPQEKAEFLSCLELVGAPQVQGLLLEAVKRAADAIRGERAQKHSHENSKVTVGNDDRDSKDGKDNKKKRKVRVTPSLQPSDPIKDRAVETALPAGNRTTQMNQADPQQGDAQHDGVQQNEVQQADVQHNDLQQGDVHHNDPPETLQPTATTFDGFVRLTRLHDSLQLQGAHPNLLSVATQYLPMSLKARLDWVDSHPHWVARMRGKPVLEFVQAFHEDTLPR